MYAIRCVKSGAFNYDLSIRKGMFVNVFGDGTKSLKNAVLLCTKQEAGWHRRDVTNRGNVYIKRRAGKTILPARFEIVRVELTVKE